MRKGGERGVVVWGKGRVGTRGSLLGRGRIGRSLGAGDLVGRGRGWVVKR